MKSSWQAATLGEVCEMYQPKTITAKEMSSSGDYPVYGANGIIGKYFAYNHENPELIIGCRGTCGALHISQPKSWITGNAMVIRPNRGAPLIIEFLKYFLLNPKITSSVITGTAQPQITRKALSPIKIPLPPIAEQQRIVSILDEACAAIDQAKANSERNLKNAKELFESYLQGVFENKGASWENKQLKNEVDLFSGFPFKSKQYSEKVDDVLLVKGDNIMQGYFRWDDEKRWNIEEFDKYNRFSLNENDIVLAMDRPWVKAGLKCAKISKNELPALLVQRTASLRCGENIDSGFLYYLIKSSGFTNYLLGVQTGIGVPHISGQQILDFSFNCPSIQEQQTIVIQLDYLNAETQKLEAVYQKKLFDLDELKKSILQKAFTGELTTV